MGRQFLKPAVEFECLVCRENIEGGRSNVVNKADLCVDLSGVPSARNKVPMANLRPEINCLPKMALCPDHRRQRRKQTGGEWVTVTEASAMLDRRMKRPNEAAAPGFATALQAKLTKVYVES
jgi:hypothetical protein